ncbi:hypothetical protein [Bradyrhizobium sp. 27S5]|uniref:hypothetical protein n=1 Tax=Bradyrhizobium sp. 27S5 TaxID=3139728 RepID=UPI0030D1B9BE
MHFDHISSAIRETGTPAEMLDGKQRQALIIVLLERLGVNVTTRAPWDKRTAHKDRAASEGRQMLGGWRLISGYVGANTCLLFLEGAREIWKFRNGSDLLRVLSDCPPLEFYVCDQDASYLLCSNHHDFVIGWGVALSWVQRLGGT